MSDDIKEKLYCVKIEYTLFVVAGNATEAEDKASSYLREDGNEPDFIMSREVKSIDKIPEEWRNSIPFGGDQKDERTCSQRLIEQKV